MVRSKQGLTKKLTQPVWDPQIFLPFPRNCISLLTAPTNSGKSTYLQHIVEHAHLFFAEPLNRIIVLNCHSLVSPYQLEQHPSSPWPLPTIEHYLLEDFHTDVLEANDLLIVEDLQNVTPNIRLLITAITHHVNLAACFIVTHSLLGSSQFELLSHVHKVILFLKSAAVARLALYIVRHFFVDPNLKTWLKSILATAESQKAIIHLEINPIAGTASSHHLVLSHLLELTQPKGFCILYPHLNTMNVYQEQEIQSSSQVESLDSSVLDTMPDNLHPDSFILLNAKTVAQWKTAQASAASEEADTCAQTIGEKEWTQACHALEDLIHDIVPAKNLFKAKSLVKELLKNPDFCLDLSGRTMHLIDRPRVTFSVLDYVLLATRQSGPNEMLKVNDAQYKLYRIVTKMLLRKNTPTQLIKNKVLLSSAYSAAMPTTTTLGTAKSAARKSKTAVLPTPVAVVKLKRPTTTTSLSHHHRRYPKTISHTGVEEQQPSVSPPLPW